MVMSSSGWRGRGGSGAGVDGAGGSGVVGEGGSSTVSKWRDSDNNYLVS